jgi:DNA-binding IclR family transcriptional regulator
VKGPAESARVHGRDGHPAPRRASGRAGRDAPLVSGAGGGVMAAEKSVRAWEAAYRRYGQVWELSARASKDDLATARQMASASWAVAAAWRQIAAATTLPWWVLVAIEAAASAFETQAHEYQSRQENKNRNYETDR